LPEENNTIPGSVINKQLCWVVIHSDGGMEWKRTVALSVTFGEVQSSNPTPIKCTALNTSHSMTRGNDITVSQGRITQSTVSLPWV
jgi:hypothetical protein